MNTEFNLVKEQLAMRKRQKQIPRDKRATTWQRDIVVLRALHEKGLEAAFAARTLVNKAIQ